MPKSTIGSMNHSSCGSYFSVTLFEQRTLLAGVFARVTRLSSSTDASRRPSRFIQIVSTCLCPRRVQIESHAVAWTLMRRKRRAKLCGLTTDVLGTRTLKVLGGCIIMRLDQEQNGAVRLKRRGRDLLMPVPLAWPSAASRERGSVMT